MWNALLGERIEVHLLIKGRIGEGWYDIDRQLKLRPGATLRDLFDHCERKGIPIRDLIAASPHLSETLMLNGERCPVAENDCRRLEDNDQVYLLGPVVGG